MPIFSRMGICTASRAPVWRSRSLTSIGQSNFPRQRLPLSCRYFSSAARRPGGAGSTPSLHAAEAERPRAPVARTFVFIDGSLAGEGVVVVGERIQGSLQVVSYLV